MGTSIVLNGNDWKDLIEPEIADDLKKYRTYRPDSVRDLLRALRNKVSLFKIKNYECKTVNRCIIS